MNSVLIFVLEIWISRKEYFYDDFFNDFSYHWTLKFLTDSHIVVQLVCVPLKKQRELKTWEILKVAESEKFWGIITCIIEELPLKRSSLFRKILLNTFFKDTLAKIVWPTNIFLSILVRKCLYYQWVTRKP